MKCMENDTINTRLSRIEGQIRGVKEMVAGGRKCEDIIMQLSAVNAAITATAKEILNNHISHCVVDAIKAGNQLVVNDLLVVIDSFAKMK